MAKIKKIEKARGEYKCSKCGDTIHKGDSYLRGERFRLKPLIRCVKCGIKSYELSQSDYVRTVGEICEEWRETYGIGEDTPTSICEELENLRDDLQERLDNMPENLRDTSEAGETLQNRIDNLEDVISQLENMSYEDFEGEAEENAKDELDRDDFSTEAEWEGAVENLKVDKQDELLADAIDEALGSLEY